MVRRFRFRFRLRTLLIFVALLGVGARFGALLISANKRSDAVQAILRSNPGRAAVYYSYQFDGAGNLVEGAAPSWPEWLRNLLGKDFFFDVVAVEHIDENGAEYLALLPGLRKLTIDSLLPGQSIEFLQRLPVLHDLEVQGWWDNDFARAADVLASMSSLRVLRVDGEVTDKGLNDIARLTQLESVRICCAPVTDAGLAALGALNHLKTLEVSYAGVNGAGGLENPGGITGSGLSALASLSNLEELRLHHTRLTGTKLGSLHALRKLRVLDLRANQITPEEIGVIDGMPPLSELDLSENRELGDVGVLLLVKGQWQLRTLHLHRVGLTDAGLSEIGRLTSLQTLDVGGNRLTEVGVRHLGPLVNLTDLDLSAEDVQQAEFDFLACQRGRANKPLPEDVRRRARIGDPAIETLRSLSRLRILDLSGSHMSDRAVGSLAELKELERLSLHANCFLSDEGVKSLSALTNLASLDVGFTYTTDDGLRALQRLPHLSALSLNATPITNASLAILGGYPALRDLQIQATSVNDGGVSTLQNFSLLAQLDIDHTAVTERGLAMLRKSLSGCTVKDYNPRRKTPWPSGLDGF